MGKTLGDEENENLVLDFHEFVAQYSPGRGGPATFVYVVEIGLLAHGR